MLSLIKKRRDAKLLMAYLNFRLLLLWPLKKIMERPFIDLNNLLNKNTDHHSTTEDFKRCNV